jgi:hypothetical protein
VFPVRLSDHHLVVPRLEKGYSCANIHYAWRAGHAPQPSSLAEGGNEELRRHVVPGHYLACEVGEIRQPCLADSGFSIGLDISDLCSDWWMYANCLYCIWIFFFFESEFI